MERRNVLAAAAAASVALLPIRTNAYEGLPEDVGAALDAIRTTCPTRVQLRLSMHR